MGAALPVAEPQPTPLRSSASLLCRPWPMAAVAALAVNDHLLKGSGLLPGWLTGKLSDVAGLAFFPLLLLALAEPLVAWLARRVPSPLDRRRLALVCAAATVVVFAAIKLEPHANALACRAWGPMVADPTDLVALPAAFLGLRGLTDDGPAEPLPRWLQALGVVLAALASIATPAPARVRSFPAWELEPRTTTVAGCAELEAWVSKSGKSGVGLTVRARNTGEKPCSLSITEARFDAGETSNPATTLPPPQALSAFHVVYLYLPFVFDNEDLWNDGERVGSFELKVQGGSAEPTVWKLPAAHRIDDLRHPSRSSP